MIDFGLYFCRSGAYYLFEQSHACWDVVINDYGAILSTFFALATFAALFFFAYALRRTLSPRPNPFASATAGAAAASAAQAPGKSEQQRGGQQYPGGKKKRRKGHHHPRSGGGGHRSGRLRSNHQQQQQHQHQQQINSDVPGSSCTSLNANPKDVTRALPALLEDKTVSPPLVIGESNASDGSGVKPLTAIHGKTPAQQQSTNHQGLTSCAVTSSSRDRTLSTASTEDSTVASDDLSYESGVSGRSTPTMSSPVDKPSVVQTDDTGGKNPNSCTTKGKHPSRNQPSRRGVKKSGVARNAQSQPASSAVSASTPHLSPPPTPNRWAALKSCSSGTGTKTNRNAQRGQRGSNRIGQLPSSNNASEQPRLTGAHSNSNHRLEQGGIISKSPGPSQQPRRRQKQQHQHHQHQQPKKYSGGLDPVGAFAREETKALAVTPPRTGQSAGPNSSRPSGSARERVKAAESQFHSPARTLSAESPFGTPASIGSAGQSEASSFFSTTWNDALQSSWSNCPPSPSNLSGAIGGSSSSINPPPGLMQESSSSSRSSVVHSFVVQQQMASGSVSQSVGDSGGRGGGGNGDSSIFSGLSLPPGSSPMFRPTKIPLNSVKDNPFLDEQVGGGGDDIEQIEAELQELGGQMVGSVLDF